MTLLKPFYYFFLRRSLVTNHEITVNILDLLITTGEWTREKKPPGIIKWYLVLYSKLTLLQTLEIFKKWLAEMGLFK